MIIATFDELESGLGKKRRIGDERSSSSSDEVVLIEPGIRDNVQGWAYIGSANFTPSAWGKLSGSSFNPVLNVCLSTYKGE